MTRRQYDAPNTFDAALLDAGIGNMPMAPIAAMSDASSAPHPSSARPARYVPGVGNAHRTTVTVLVNPITNRQNVNNVSPPTQLQIRTGSMLLCAWGGGGGGGGGVHAHCCHFAVRAAMAAEGSIGAAPLLKNSLRRLDMWARNFVANSSLPHASAQAGSRCSMLTTSLSQAVLSVCAGASALSVAISVQVVGVNGCQTPGFTICAYVAI